MTLGTDCSSETGLFLNDYRKTTTKDQTETSCTWFCISTAQYLKYFLVTFDVWGFLMRFLCQIESEEYWFCLMNIFRMNSKDYMYSGVQFIVN